MRLSALVLAVLFVPVSGCIGGFGTSANPATSSPVDDIRRHVNISSEDLSSRPTNLVVTLRSTRDANFTLSVGNGMQNAREYANASQTVWSSCGSLGFESSEGEAPSIEPTFAWSYSDGHLLRLHAGGDRVAVNHSAAVDNYFGLGHVTGTYQDLELPRGAYLRLSVGADEGGNRSFDPWINVSAEEPSFEVVDRTRYGFTCGATFAPFDSVVVDTGIPGAPMTVARDATARFETSTGTQALFGIQLSSWPASGASGYCRTSILVDAEPVNGTDRNPWGCVLSASASAGQVDLRIDELVGNGPKVSLFLYDRPF